MPRQSPVIIAGLSLVLLASATGLDSTGSQPDAASLATLSRAHSHNDYEHPRPLRDALDHGFSSVEADVWLVGDRLLVAHDREAVRADSTLEALYLDPLQDRVRRHGGRVHPGGPRFLLWIDVKSDAEATYVALKSILARHTGMLTVFRPDGVEHKAVEVILSGNRPRNTMAREAVRYVALDGRLSDLESDASHSLIPVISDNWQRHFQWRGTGPMPPGERAKLRRLVQQAHRQQRRIRFWAIPDRGEGWQESLDAGVDFINTDDLAGLRRFLLASARPPA